jgi:hypothetical protein
MKGRWAIALYILKRDRPLHLYRHKGDRPPQLTLSYLPSAMQQAQHFAGLFGIEDDAVLRELDGAAPLEALGIAQQVEAVDGHLRIFRQSDDVVAQAATAGQFAGERGQRELRLLGERRRPGVLNGEHFRVSSLGKGEGNPENRSPKDVEQVSRAT